MGTDHHRDVRRRSYYAVLGVRSDASLGEIRCAYRKLAMKWHPDRWGRKPWLVEEANRRFQEIQEAYQVLSDQRKRTLYDAGLYDPLQDEEEEDEVEGFSGFLQEMLKLMANVRREEKEYSLDELQQMLADMAQGFHPPPPVPSPPCFELNEGSPRGSKRSRGDTYTLGGMKSRMHVSGLGVFGSMSCYRDCHQSLNDRVNNNPKFSLSTDENRACKDEKTRIFRKMW